MKNKLMSGGVLHLALAAVITSGAARQVGQLFGVATTDGAIGDVIAFETRGVFSLPVLGTDDVGVGDLLYWDAANARLTLTATDNLLVGAATAASGVSVTTVEVYIDGTVRAQEPGA